MEKPEKKTQSTYGWHSMPDKLYFSLPYLSNSGLKLFNLSPAHLKQSLDSEALRAAGKADPDEPTPALIFGKAFHYYQLGFPGKIAVTPEGIDRRTKVGKTAWEYFCKNSEGKAIISADDFEAIKAMNKSLMAHPKASKLLTLKDTLREAAGIFEHPVYGYPCKIKTDLVSTQKIGTAYIVSDIKTTICAHPDEFNRSIFNFKYHWQAYWYLKGAKALTGNDHKFMIIAVEKTPPYAVAVYEIGKAWLDIARPRIEPLETLYADCLASNDWQGYSNRVIISRPEKWMAYK